MDESYKVTIRCDHVVKTHGGAKRVQPRIATAQLTNDGVDHTTGAPIKIPLDEGEWAYFAARGGSIFESRRDVEALPSSERVLRNATESQRRDTRIAIACVTCNQRLVARRERLDQVFEKIRHAGAHTVALSDIRVNL